MKVKTYQAYTMAEALAAVRRDLGAGAVILNTRTFRRGGFFGLGRKTIVEVSATPPESAPASGPQRKGRRGAPGSAAARAGSAAAQRAYAKAGIGDEEAGSAVTDDDRERTRRLAQALMAKFEKQSAQQQERLAGNPEQSARSESAEPAAAQPHAGSSETLRETETAAPDHASRQSEHERAEQTQRFPVARRFILTPADERVAEALDAGATGSRGAMVAATAGSAGAPATGRASRPRATAPVTRRGPMTIYPASDQTAVPADAASIEMQDELAAIRTMVGQVLQRQGSASRAGGPTPTMPARLFAMYLKLIGQDISDELADRVINDVRDELTVEQLEDEAIIRKAVLRHLADYIPVAEQAVAHESPDERPLTIALIGPTGVGKTTTVAKLAASFKLRHQKRVGLITSDTYRIAAVEQLRTYANIIGLPLQVVLSPTEMREAVHTLSDCDVILIDTAGRSQNDASRLDELARFVEAGDPHEVHLVLSGTASEKVLLREAEAFGAIGVDKVVLTKLDEAVSFGMLISVMRQVGKELSFVTTGQEVPDHIEVGRPERLAELVLGGEIDP